MLTAEFWQDKGVCVTGNAGSLGLFDLEMLRQRSLTENASYGK